MYVKQFDEYVNESFKGKLSKVPDLGSYVIGSDGGRYKVVDYCYAKDSSDTNKLLSAYDASGAMRQEIDAGNFSRSSIIVALEDETGCYSVWFWDETWLTEE